MLHMINAYLITQDGHCGLVSYVHQLLSFTSIFLYASLVTVIITCSSFSYVLVFSLRLEATCCRCDLPGHFTVHALPVPACYGMYIGPHLIWSYLTCGKSNSSGW